VHESKKTLQAFLKKISSGNRSVDFRTKRHPNLNVKMNWKYLFDI